MWNCETNESADKSCLAASTSANSISATCHASMTSRWRHSATRVVNWRRCNCSTCRRSRHVVSAMRYVTALNSSRSLCTTAIALTTIVSTSSSNIVIRRWRVSRSELAPANWSRHERSSAASCAVRHWRHWLSRATASSRWVNRQRHYEMTVLICRMSNEWNWLYSTRVSRQKPASAIRLTWSAAFGWLYYLLITPRLSHLHRQKG